jgi:co-chaperonin GroES (HSP10)
MNTIGITSIEDAEPLGAFVLCVPETPAQGQEYKTPGGVIVPGTVKSYFSIVLKAGPDCKQVKKGDRIVYHQGAKFPHGNQEYSVAHENQILVRVPASSEAAAAE